MSLERLVPDNVKGNETTGIHTLQLHLERYWFVAQHLRPGRVLDIACGVGYGALELIQKAGEEIQELVAVDISAESIAFAQTRYAHPKIRFSVQDALTYTSAERFDTIVSLETVEHLPNPELFLQHMQDLLHPGGRLICSAPVTPSVDVNPYHLHDFTEKSLRALGERLGLREVTAFRQNQPFNVFGILSKKEERA